MRKVWFIGTGFALGAICAAAVMLLFTHRAAPPKELSIDRELDRTIDQIDLENVPFNEAVKQIQKLTPVPISIDYAALRASALDKQTPTTIHGVNLTLRRTLDQLTFGNGQVREAGYAVRDGRIIITSAAEATSYRMLRTYDVSGLVARSTVLGDELTYAPPPSARFLTALVEAIPSDLERLRAGFNRHAWYLGGRLVVADDLAGQREVVQLLSQLNAPDPTPVSPMAASAFGKDWPATGNSVSQEEFFRRPIPRIDIDRKPFEAAVESLRQLCSARIQIDREELPLQKTAELSPISIHLANASLSEALDELVCMQDPKGSLGYTVEDGIARLTARYKADRNDVVRIYDVRDLLPPANTMDGERAMDALMTFLWKAIDPEVWTISDKFPARVYETNGRIIVVQSWSTQERLARLLATLRASGTRLVEVHELKRSPSNR